jgi:SAM-dependent methyltransferase
MLPTNPPRMNAESSLSLPLPGDPDDLLPRETGTGKRILDVGCGPGSTLAKVPGGWSTFGVDFVRAPLVKAVQTCPGAGFVQGKAKELPTSSACFDFVIAKHSLPYTFAGEFFSMRASFLPIRNKPCEIAAGLFTADIEQRCL